MIVQTNQKNDVTGGRMNVPRMLPRDISKTDTDKNTVDTVEIAAEDDLLSINDLIDPIIPINEQDSYNITAWSHHPKIRLFRRKTPMKQPSDNTKIDLENITHVQSATSRVNGSRQKRSDLKAKLRHYEFNHSFSLKEEEINLREYRLPLENQQKNIEKINLAKFQNTYHANKMIYRRKVAIFHPYYCESSRKNKKQNKSTKSHSTQNPTQISDRQNSASQLPRFKTISITTQLRFPIISEDTRLQTRLNFYLKNSSFSR